MSSLYLYLKSFHLLASFAWMAGMLYLPRLYAYHAEVGAFTPQAETFKRMENGLLRIIMNPAMVITLVLGIYLGFFADATGQPTLSGGLWAKSPWLHAKIALVILMVGLHGMLAKWRKDFAADRVPYPARTFRIINEVPSILLIGIVILVIVKPF